MANARILGTLMAAGYGQRFGGNKLEAMLNGAMIGEHAARALAGCGCDRMIAISAAGTPALDTMLDGLGFERIANPAPEAGLSQSLALAAHHALECDADGMLVCLGDMPFVTSVHLDRLLAAFDGAGHTRCITSQGEGHRSPPAVFPRSHFAALTALSGDRGAQTLLQEAVVVVASSDMLSDIDTRHDLERMMRAPSPRDE